MELNSLVGVRQPDGRRIADEVHFVAPRGKLHPQLRSHHARASISWITCNPNFHLVERAACPSAPNVKVSARGNVRWVPHPCGLNKGGDFLTFITKIPISAVESKLPPVQMREGWHSTEG